MYCTYLALQAQRHIAHAELHYSSHRSVGLSVNDIVRPSELNKAPLFCLGQLACLLGTRTSTYQLQIRVGLRKYLELMPVETGRVVVTQSIFVRHLSSCAVSCAFSWPASTSYCALSYSVCRAPWGSHQIWLPFRL